MGNPWSPWSSWKPWTKAWNPWNRVWNPWNGGGIHPFHLESIWNILGSVKYWMYPLSQNAAERYDEFLRIGRRRNC